MSLSVQKVVSDQNDHLSISMVRERSSRSLSIYSANDWRAAEKLNDHPTYQREYIKKFDESFKTCLIESVLCNAPIPSIYLCRKISENGSECYEIIDGQQRVKTLLDFLNDEWPLKRKYLDAEKWKEEERDRLAGAYFSALPDNLQSQYRSYELHCDIFTESDSWSAKDIYNRLNRATTNLNAMEILKGEFADNHVWKELHRFSNKSEWMDFATGKRVPKGKPDKRNIRYKALESLFHHLLLADLGMSSTDSNLVHIGTKGKMTTSFIEEICATDSQYDPVEAVKRTREFMGTCYLIFGEFPFQLIRLHEGGSMGGERDKKFFTMHFQIISYIISRAISEYGIHKLSLNKNSIFEQFHSIVNDDRTMITTAEDNGKTLRYHFIEGRVMGHSALNQRINLYWPLIQEMLDYSDSVVGTLAPDRLDDLWSTVDNRCMFTNKQIARKEDAVVAHINWQRSNYRVERNLVLTSRLENWLRSKNLGPRKLS